MIVRYPVLDVALLPNVKYCPWISMFEPIVDAPVTFNVLLVTLPLALSVVALIPDEAVSNPVTVAVVPTVKLVPTVTANVVCSD